MALISKTRKKECWRGHGETAGGNANGADPTEDSVDVPQKLRIETPPDPAVPLLGTYPGVHRSIVDNSQGTDQLKRPWWMTAQRRRDTYT